MVSNTYDAGALTDVPSMQMHDAAYGTGFVYRGNVTAQTMPGKSATMSYDIGGNPGQTQVNGVTTNASFQTGTNFALPSSITTGSLTETFAYSAFLAPTGVTGPNGDSTSMTYDTYGRPQTATAPAGAVTSYAYSGSAPWTSTATTNGRWTRATMDGFGRTVKTEVGTGGTTVSVVDSVYDACGCSPLGKLKQTSMPHAPGAGAVWTVNSYDGMGRTTRVTMADGSHKDYVYFADTVLATDEAGKWKKYTVDVLGNLVTVEEPNPAGGSLYSYYQYDMLGHLTRVDMARATGSQYRTFNYGTPPGPYLLSARNPENGTVTHTYNSNGTVATKTDAKGQQIQYSYL